MSQPDAPRDLQHEVAPASPAEDELIHGFSHRLFDGYDGDGRQPSQEMLEALFQHAPPEVSARAEEFARLNNSK